MIQAVKQEAQFPVLNWGSTVPVSRWEDLTSIQRDNIILELESRGLKVIQSMDCDRMRVVRITPGTPAELFAERDEDSFIPLSAWDALASYERQEARRLLALRGLDVYPHWNSLHDCESVSLIPLGSSDHPVRLVSTYPAAFLFTCHIGDKRLDACDDIEINVLNCRSEHEAAEKLTRWLGSITKLGSVVEADDDPEDADEEEGDEAESETEAAGELEPVAA